MNITELARKLKIATKELRAILPGLGFDIGVRAIKVDENLVPKIIAAWGERQRQVNLQKNRDQVIRAADETEAVAVENIIKIPGVISVHNLAACLNLPVNKVMAELMNNGVMVTINEEIDFETAAIIAEDLGLKVERDLADSLIVKEEVLRDTIKRTQNLQTKTNLKPRPPVVVVMGHVDHGKTSLLDAIRQTDIVSAEAGAITQHIGAYELNYQGHPITFIDTPGHEAFKSMRVRGGAVADIAILVIAADDDIKPQTLESIRVIEQEKLSLIVAINKIDKPEADCNQVKTSLAALNLAPEGWGGQTICVEVSALTKQGIDNLLEMILLVADLEKENLLADYSCPAIGTVIESHKDKNEGPVATVLIQTGTCRVGDQIIIGGTFGKIRALKNYQGKNILSAAPGVPVSIFGLKAAPNVGDILETLSDQKALKKRLKAGLIKKTVEPKITLAKAEKFGAKNTLTIKNLNLVLRADVDGSLEAIVNAISEIKHQEININIIKKGLGQITESDILGAEGTEISDKSLVIGFNVGLNLGVKTLAQEKGINIKIYRLIYELVDDIKKNLESLLSLERVRYDVGQLEVLKIFRTESDSQIIGGRVISGKVQKDLIVDVLRADQILGAGRLTELQSNRQAVHEMKSGSECGLKFVGKVKIEIGDRLEFYRLEDRARTL